MDDQKKDWGSQFPVAKLHILWAVCGMLTLAVLMVWIVLSDGDKDSDAADKSTETEAVASEERDVQSVEEVEVRDIQSVEAESSNEKNAAFLSGKF